MELNHRPRFLSLNQPCVGLGWRQTRNFSTLQRRIYGEIGKPQNRNPSLAGVLG
jgi:hypothetical protein